MAIIVSGILRTATLDGMAVPCMSPQDNAKNKNMHLLSDTGGGCEV